MKETFTVTEIYRPVTVHSERGRVVRITSRNSFGLSLCKSGQITYTLNGKTYVSTPGCAVLLPKGGTYTIHGDKEGLFPVINFEGIGFLRDCIVVLPLEHPQDCIRDFEVLENLFIFSENRMEIFAQFYALLSKIFTDTPPERKPLEAVVRYIETHLASQALSNTQLADTIGVSEVYFRRLFSEQYHTTPKQYILNLRIRKAKQLLTDTALTVTAIAEQCGFSGVYHFCRAFKAKTGVTPTQYAANHKRYHI